MAKNGSVMISNYGLRSKTRKLAGAAESAEISEQPTPSPKQVVRIVFKTKDTTATAMANKKIIKITKATAKGKVTKPAAKKATKCPIPHLSPLHKKSPKFLLDNEEEAHKAAEIFLMVHRHGQSALRGADSDGYNSDATISAPSSPAMSPVPQTQTSVPLPHCLFKPIPKELMDPAIGLLMLSKRPVIHNGQN